MKKSAIFPFPRFFEKYIHLVDDIDLKEGLELYKGFNEEFISGMERVGDKTYAEGKWTVRDILQHVIDNERIQSYRALRIARKDNTVLPGYDVQLFGKNAKANRRTIEELAEEFSILRKANIFLFKSFDEEDLIQKGICYNVEISVLALGFVLIGHQIHHMKIIEEKYFCL